MSNLRNYQTGAIITKKTKLGEVDSIITFNTPGRIQGFDGSRSVIVGLAMGER